MKICIKHFDREAIFSYYLVFLGESGLGKSTLINSLFLTDIYTSAQYEDAASKFGKTMSV